MKKILAICFLLALIFVIFLLFFYQKKDIVVSGILEHNTDKVEFFQVNNRFIVANPVAGITDDLLASYANKEVRVIGALTYIKLGTTGPDCKFTQIGCDRKVSVILPKSIEVIGPTFNQNVNQPATEENQTQEISLDQEFTLHENQSAIIKNIDFAIKITQFYNSPCPKGAQCIWSGVGIAFEYKHGGEIQKGIDLKRAFGFLTTVIDTDNETFAKLKITQIDNSEVNYTCPEKSSYNCQPVVGGEVSKYCAYYYRQWAVKNCGTLYID